MKFLDAVRIETKAGNGGSGATVFFQDWKQKFSRPSGGDGGNGGDVVLVASSNVSTLIFFQTHSLITAKNGQNGNRNNRHGKNGDSIFLKVPVGTLIFDASKKKLLFDFTFHGQEFVVAKGGNGGLGNASLTRKHRKTIKYSQPGFLGQHKKICLDLRFLSQFALIGLPNVGKTSLLNAITNAHGKVGNYHFTTLTPNLGLINDSPQIMKQNLFVSDLPGIIENAYQNKGLGNQFLKHAERSYVLLHVLDLSKDKKQILQDFQLINNELFQYNAFFATIPQIIIGNKSDLLTYQINLADFQDKRFILLDFIPVSSVVKHNLSILVKCLGQKLQTLSNLQTVLEKTMQNQKMLKTIYTYDADRSIRLRKLSDNTWELSSIVFDELLIKWNLNNADDLQQFYDFLKKSNIFRRLQLEGVQKSDLIYIAKQKFYWQN